MPWRITTDGAARAEGKRGYTMPSRDGGRQSQIRNYPTRGAGDPREQAFQTLQTLQTIQTIQTLR